MLLSQGTLTLALGTAMVEATMTEKGELASLLFSLDPELSDQFCWTSYCL